MDTNHFSTSQGITSFSNSSIIQRLTKLMGNDDHMYCVISVHLLTEKMLEMWSESASKNPKMFDDTKLSFNAKLSLSKNFGLPINLYLAIKKLNTLRNQFGHNLNKTEIADSDITELENHLVNVDPSSNFKEYKINSGNQMVKYSEATNAQKMCGIGYVIMTSFMAASTQMMQR